LGGEPEPFLEADARFEAEQLARRGDVRPRVADVAGAVGQELLPDRAAENLPDGLRELVDGRAAARGDVEHGAVDVAGLRGEHVRLDDVRDVGEVARLRAFAGARHLPALRDQGAEPPDDRRGLPRWILARAGPAEVA